MLTSKQNALLLFINQRLKETGVSPSFEEMKLALELKSKSGIHRLISALEERGFIRRLHHKARALEILKLPSTAAGTQSAVSRNGDNVVEGAFNQRADNGDLARTVAGAEVELPLLGKIAAGTPIVALQDLTRTIAVPQTLLASDGDHFALEIEGDSMTDVGILDGDVAVIESDNTAMDGTIVVALVDDEEATLKRLRRRGSSVALEAANPDYETRIFGPDRVKVQGRLVGIIRKY